MIMKMINISHLPRISYFSRSIHGGIMFQSKFKIIGLFAESE